MSVDRRWRRAGSLRRGINRVARRSGVVEPAIVERARTTDRQPAGLTAHRADVDPWVRDRILVALSALQVGVCESALQQTAAYVSQREQFGRPIGTFQAVAHRAADAYVDLESMRVTMLAAAWKLDNGVDAAAMCASPSGGRLRRPPRHSRRPALHGGIRL